MFRSAIVCFAILASFSFVYTSPAKKAFWNGTPMDQMVEEMRSMCNDENDSFSCMKFKVMNFLDTILSKDNYKVSFITTVINIYLNE
jgi:hypothetical protein